MDLCSEAMEIMGALFMPTSAWIADATRVGRILDGVVEQIRQRTSRDCSAVDLECAALRMLDDDARDWDEGFIDDAVDVDGCGPVDRNIGVARERYIEAFIERGERDRVPRLLVTQGSDSMQEIVAALADAGLLDRVGLVFDSAPVMLAICDRTADPLGAASAPGGEVG
jgi:hypothetical protein